MEQMIHAYHRRRAGGAFPPVRPCWRPRSIAGDQHPHAVLPEGYQRNRRLPHVRGGLRRAARLQAACVLPGDAEGMVVKTNTPAVRETPARSTWS